VKTSSTVQYDPRFIEEAVFHAPIDRTAGLELREARNRIYEVPDLERRDDLFNDLNHFWFSRLRLGRVIDQALLEQTIVSAKVEKCFVVRASHRKQEGAELFVADDPHDAARRVRTLRILLRPESLFEPEALSTFLRHELYHIADMLDPRFAYEPVLPKAEGGPTYDSLVTGRYRVLWDTTISGRMMRRGWYDQSVRERQLSEFVGAFPMLHDRLEESFSRFFDCEQPKHADLARFAFDPRQASGSLQQHAAPGTHCPLCRFPTHTFEIDPGELSGEVLAALKQDFPDWSPSQGLCLQCADLYRGRQLSMASLRALPGYQAGPEQE
jgi:hypothetical protein